MNKEPSLFEEDYIPTGGAGFGDPLLPVSIDDVLDVLAHRSPYDANGRDAGYWFNQIIFNSELAELPITVAAEMINNAAAHNDGSHRQMRRWLEEIIEDLL